MRANDKYMGYDGKEVLFECIAIPLQGNMIQKKSGLIKFDEARVQGGEGKLDVYTSAHGAVFIDSNIPYVIYQTEGNYGTNKVEAMQVDKYFGGVKVGKDWKPRYVLMENEGAGDSENTRLGVP